MRSKKFPLLAAVMGLALTACGDNTDDAQGAASAATLERITALKNRLADLEAQAHQVEHGNDIKRLQRAYGYYIDKALWDDAADLFSDNASIEYANEGVYIGKDRIREYFHRLGGGKVGLSEGQINDHMQLQPIVSVTPDGLTAKARWRAFIQSGKFGESATWGEGTYENEYVNEGGVWKISKLHWYVTFLAPYELGWAKIEPVDRIASAFTADFPPDRPPTEDYKPFPGVYFPPFHFDPSITANLQERAGHEADH